jgi:hypothetical protein
MTNRRQSNAEYYERTRDRIILRESELRPSTILELLDCLGDLDPHPADRRIGRLRQLYLDLTGHEAPQPHGDQS